MHGRTVLRVYTNQEEIVLWKKGFSTSMENPAFFIIRRRQRFSLSA
jgi:hypothetical protein